MNAMKKLIASFGYALHGLIFCIKTCRNFRIHTVAAALVLWISRFYDFNKSEYGVILLTIALVISCEAMNSALEEACQSTLSEKIKHAKDAAACAVLLAALFAVVIAVLFFYDLEVFTVILNYFSNAPFNLLC